MADYLFNFGEVPPIGTILTHPRSGMLTLFATEPFVRKDGAQTTLLFWRNQYGRIGCTGLMAKSIIWGNAPQAMRDFAECNTGLLIKARAECAARNLRLGTTERPGGLPQNKENIDVTMAKHADSVFRSIGRGQSTIGRINGDCRMPRKTVQDALNLLVAQGRIMISAHCRSGGVKYEVAK